MDFCYGPSTFNQFLWEIENKWFALLTVETVSVTMLNRCSIKMNSFNNNLWCAIVLVRPLSRLPMQHPFRMLRCEFIQTWLWTASSLLAILKDRTKLGLWSASGFVKLLLCTEFFQFESSRERTRDWGGWECGNACDLAKHRLSALLESWKLVPRSAS